MMYSLPCICVRRALARLLPDDQAGCCAYRTGNPLAHSRRPADGAEHAAEAGHHAASTFAMGFTMPGLLELGTMLGLPGPVHLCRRIQIDLAKAPLDASQRSLLLAESLSTISHDEHSPSHH
jgi:hypothetical protein